MSDQSRETCPLCGVVKVLTSEGLEFETKASRIFEIRRMSPAEFNTKVCRHLRCRDSCINESQEYAPNQDLDKICSDM